MSAAVEAGDIVEVVWVSLAVSIAVTVAFSFVVLGLARSMEAARTGHGTAALTYAGFALLAFIAFAATVAFGVHIMLTKG